MTDPLYIREAQVTYQRSGKLPEAARGRVGSSRDVAPLLIELIGNRVTESFLVVAMTTKRKIIGYHETSRGGTSNCPVGLADVFRYPIMAGAESIILAHNHPSGETAPSDDDITMTARIVAAGKLLGISVLDHLIVTDEKYFSLLDSGLMKPGG